MECFCGSVLVDNMVKLKGEDKTQRKGKRLTEPVDTPAVPRGVSSPPLWTSVLCPVPIAVCSLVRLR